MPDDLTASGWILPGGVLLRLSPRRPTQNHAGFWHSGCNEFARRSRPFKKFRETQEHIRTPFDTKQGNRPWR
jgi:hypothetical protein